MATNSAASLLRSQVLGRASQSSGPGLAAALGLAAATNAALLLGASGNSRSGNNGTQCEANNTVPGNEGTSPKRPGVDIRARGTYGGSIPARQLWRPRVPYPLWDHDWDDASVARKDTSSIVATSAVVRRNEDDGKCNDESKSFSLNQSMSSSPSDNDRCSQTREEQEGVTRHVILVRHGQHDCCDVRNRGGLTDLGRKQADLTGARLASMLKGAGEAFGPCKIGVIRVSDMDRAKETAEIISRHLPGITQTKPDSLLNEGIPAQIIPARPGVRAEEGMDENHNRIEEAFRKYLWRSSRPSHHLEDEVGAIRETIGDSGGDKEEQRLSADEQGGESRHKFEVIVCHGNVIRYFFCRALQLPPEAWLRLSVFNCSLTYLMIKPNGTVSCRLLGDIGHLGHDHTSFSMRQGLAWS